MMQYDRLKRTVLIAGLLIGLLGIRMGSEANAQDIQSTPLSRLGYGTLQNSGPVAWRGMGGTGVGMNDKRVINLLNPAGYGATDSLSFLMDVGVSVNMSHYNDGKGKKNSFLGGLDYLAIQFPLLKDRLAFSTGLIPISNVGYGLTSSVEISGENGVNKLVQNFVGGGSLQALYLGLGTKLWDNFYLGANAKYLFGKVTHRVHLVPNTTSLAQTYTENSIQWSDWAFDVGAQYRFVLKNKRKDEVIIGATYAPRLPIRPELAFFENRNFGSQNKPEIYQKKTTVRTSVPHKIAGGISWTIPDKLILAADYGVELWSDTENIFTNDGVKMLDRHYGALGMEFRPDLYARKYYKKMSYRMGVNYSSSYMELPMVGALRTVGASVGIGMPISVPNSDRLSVINLTLEYQKSLSPITKNFSQDVLKLSLGINFNETWFRKLKIY